MPRLSVSPMTFMGLVSTPSTIDALAVLRDARANSMRAPCRRAHGEAQELGQAFTQLTPTPCRPPETFVAVLVELAAGVQLGQRDLGGRALGLVLVVHLDAGGDAAAVVDDRDGVVGVDGDDDVVAVAGQRLVDGVVDDLEHQVVQAGAVRGVADVHAGALAHGLQALQDLDAGAGVILRGRGWGSVRGRSRGSLFRAGVLGFGIGHPFGVRAPVRWGLSK